MERALKDILKATSRVPIRSCTRKTMARNRGRGTRSTEWALRMRLVRCGVRGWLLQPSQVIGRPDFYFPTTRLAVFVDGCFWHQCPKCGHTPKTRTEFWSLKFALNKRRDRRNAARLRQMGISVIRIWEHELNTSKWKRVIVKAAQNERSFRASQNARNLQN